LEKKLINFQVMIDAGTISAGPRTLEDGRLSEEGSEYLKDGLSKIPPGRHPKKEAECCLTSPETRPDVAGDLVAALYEQRASPSAPQLHA